ncbi:FecR family protein [Rhodothermus profundi]|uniref:FecR family protein n=1 Tax=Rhodothermus profundi TaxID=633813 RepID=A0A1M6W1K4_9BACT|nr:FecR domain-containing protein [Rhodothermus profundi]SHK87529.1 FecR family protein [Rhodothermus profundi]
MNERSAHRLPRELEEALQERSPEVRQQIQALWDRLGMLEPPVEKAPSTNAAWEELAVQLARTPRPARPAYRQRRPRWPVAVGILLGLIGAYVLFRERTLTVPPGTIQTISLGDRATITLRAGSRLQYTLALPWMPPRQVRLTGEALFEVAPGDPLAVETAQARIEVLGTRFNVRAWPETRETRVTLLEGRVRVRPTRTPVRSLVLETPGQSVRIRTETAPVPEHLPPEQVLAWQHGGFVVIDEPVSAVLRELERTFNLRIEIAGPLPLDRRVTVLYQQQARPQAILQDLCLTLPCHYRRISRGFVVEAEPASAR